MTVVANIILSQSAMKDILKFHERGMNLSPPLPTQHTHTGYSEGLVGNWFVLLTGDWHDNIYY